MQKDTNDYDRRVVIIGAGCAGAYAAWRLSQDPGYKGFDIRVYDLLPRVGGRLVSKWMSELDSTGEHSSLDEQQLAKFNYVRKSELGGMRYLTNHYLVSYLLMEWENKKRWKTVPFQVDSKNNLFNLRGEWMTATELHDPSKTPYKLTHNERGMSPGGIFMYAMNTLLPNAALMSQEEMSQARRTFEYKGIPLHKLGFWNVVRDIVSQEAYEYAIDGFGYNTTSTNWNMADAIPWYLADFPANAQYRYLQRGYDELPMELMREAEQHGVKRHMKHALRCVTDEGDRWRLDIWDEGNKQQVEVETKSLLLAMPRTSLESLRFKGESRAGVAAIQKWYKRNVPAISPQPMFKFFLGYAHPWFRALGLTNGRTVTDSPIRQVYYWGTASDQFFTREDLLALGVKNPPAPPGANDTFNPAVVMAYTDGRNVDFWRPLFEQVHAVQDETYAASPEAGDGGLARGAAQRFNKISMVAHMGPEEKHLLDAVQQEMRRVHAVDYLPEPYLFGYADWSQYPFGGGWNSWNPGYKSWDVVKDIQALDRNAGPGAKNLHVIGEAYSQAQGWVEGAFETAEQVLHDHFELSKPAWIPEQAYNDALKVK
jgi:hypothetical protein